MLTNLRDAVLFSRHSDFVTENLSARRSLLFEVLTASKRNINLIICTHH